MGTGGQPWACLGHAKAEGCRDYGTSPTTAPAPPPPCQWPGPCFFFREGGGGALARGAMFLLSKGGSIDTRTGGPLTQVLVKNPKKNSLCMQFLACAISVNVVGTHAWYLLHLCGGCGAHIGHPFHAFTPFFLWCSTFVSHAFPSSHMQAHNSKYAENAQLQLLKR